MHIRDNGWLERIWEKCAFINSKQREVEPLYNVALNTIVAVITVLTIHQILVPPDLQGLLTLLDPILITEGTCPASRSLPY